MSAPPYMQFYVGDYLASTKRFSTLQHGAYVLLLFEMWQNGGYIENDDATLTAIAGVRPTQWARIKPTLMRHFRIENGMVTHARLLESLQSYAQKCAQLSKNGAHGGKAKALKHKKREVANASDLTKQMPIYPEPEPDREINLSAPSGAERDLSLWSEAQSRFRSPDGERACAPVLRLVTEKGPSEGSQTDGPAWMAKRPSEMTPEERLLAKAYVEAQRNG